MDGLIHGVRELTNDKPVPRCQVKKCNQDFIDNGIYICCFACTLICECEECQCDTNPHECAYLIE